MLNKVAACLIFAGVVSTSAHAQETTIFHDGQECMAGDRLLLVPFEIARTYSTQCKQIKVDEYGQTFLYRAERSKNLNAAEARLIARIAFYAKPGMTLAACKILSSKGDAAKDFWKRLKADGVCK